MKKYSETELKQIHIDQAKDCLYSDIFVDLVWTHSQIIKEIALQLSENLYKNHQITLDKNLITVGALMHDIGVYKCFDEVFNPNKSAKEYFYHAWLGEKILNSLDFPKEITRFTITHTSTGITKKDIKREKFDIPLKDYLPITNEEEIVNFADKFHSKYPNFISYQEAVIKLSKLDPSRKIKIETFVKKYGLPDLTAIHKKYNLWHGTLNKFFYELNQKQGK